MKVASYRDLTVWQRAMELVCACYSVADHLPAAEQWYGLANQLRRAAVSVPANIAEGHSRPHRREFVRFLAIARSSLKDLETHLLIARRVGYIDAAAAGAPLALADEISRMLTVMRARLLDGIDESAPRSPLRAQQTARRNSSQSRMP